MQRKELRSAVTTALYQPVGSWTSLDVLLRVTVEDRQSSGN